MSFGRELKDFVSGFQSGMKIYTDFSKATSDLDRKGRSELAPDDYVEEFERRRKPQLSTTVPAVGEQPAVQPEMAEGGKVEDEEPLVSEDERRKNNLSDQGALELSEARAASRRMSEQRGEAPDANTSKGTMRVDPSRYGDAVDGAMSFMNQTFGLKSGDGAVSTPEGSASFMSGLKRLFSGEGAADPQEVREVSRVVDPTGEMSDAQRTMTKLAATHQYWLERGEPAKAQKAAASLLQYNLLVSRRMGALAAAAIEKGDLEGGAKAAAKAYNVVPDGNEIVTGTVKNGKVPYEVRDAVTKKPIAKGEATAQEMLARAMGYASGKEALETLTSAAGVRAAKRGGGGGGGGRSRGGATDEALGDEYKELSVARVQAMRDLAEAKQDGNEEAIAVAQNRVRNAEDALMAMAAKAKSPSNFIKANGLLATPTPRVPVPGNRLGEVYQPADVPVPEPLTGRRFPEAGDDSVEESPETLIKKQIGTPGAAPALPTELRPPTPEVAPQGNDIDAESVIDQRVAPGMPAMPKGAPDMRPFKEPEIQYKGPENVGALDIDVGDAITANARPDSVAQPDFSGIETPADREAKKQGGVRVLNSPTATLPEADGFSGDVAELEKELLGGFKLVTAQPKPDGSKEEAPSLFDNLEEPRRRTMLDIGVGIASVNDNVSPDRIARDVWKLAQINPQDPYKTDFQIFRTKDGQFGAAFKDGRVLALPKETLSQLVALRVDRVKDFLEQKKAQEKGTGKQERRGAAVAAAAGELAGVAGAVKDNVTFRTDKGEPISAVGIPLRIAKRVYDRTKDVNTGVKAPSVETSPAYTDRNDPRRRYGGRPALPVE